MGVVVGDARSIPLPDGSVQTCVTSPPYFGLRDYGVDGQIGSEDSLDAFLATMVEVMREVRRVLRDDGTVWLNMGDSFASSTKGSGGTNSFQTSNMGSLYGSRKVDMAGLPAKCKMLVPHRLAIALCDDGWIVRQDIVWAKPNPMPESVTDRPTTAHEFVFLLAKQPRYYYDAEAVREPAAYGRRNWSNVAGNMASVGGGRGSATVSGGDPSAGRNKRSVWHIPSHPFPDAHFATFPPKLVEPCILAGTPQKACPTCGAGWIREVMRTRSNESWWGKAGVRHEGKYGGQAQMTESHDIRRGPTVRTRTTGWAPACDCPDNDGSGKALVLDPFAGSGTTGVVARQMGREFFGVELNPEYAAMANARIRSEGEGRTRAVDGDGRVSEQLVMGI